MRADPASDAQVFYYVLSLRIKSELNLIPKRCRDFDHSVSNPYRTLLTITPYQVRIKLMGRRPQSAREEAPMRADPASDAQVYLMRSDSI